ncbi:14 kDa proline-rich protein DC2.15-like [Euphorbia lathyris]|uniref:14 kDa proline-rich protein DC2.15-like n=1 Tax=Euphorbia lathyris TaxID=212925 RepID=UPI0033140E7D
MAAKKPSSVALFLTFNLLFFSFVSAYHGGSPSPSPSPNDMAMATATATATATAMARRNTSPSTKHMSVPIPMTSLLSLEKCPRDALKLGVCADVLGPLLGITIGNPPARPCCAILFGLVDLEAAVCFCTAIKANILGIDINIPLALSLLLSACDKDLPQGYVC